MAIAEGGGGIAEGGRGPVSLSKWLPRQLFVRCDVTTASDRSKCRSDAVIALDKGTAVGALSAVEIHASVLR